MKKLKRWLQGFAVACFIGLGKSVEALSNRDWKNPWEEPEPEKQSDEWDQLMGKYMSGTEEEQAEAEDLLLNPARNKELSRIMIPAKFQTRSIAGKLGLPVKRGRQWSRAKDIIEMEALEDKLAREHIRNYKEQIADVGKRAMK